EEIAEVVDTLRSDWITTGPKTARFEREVRDYLGAPAALAVSSATDGMLVALAALGVKPGGEVITTTMTFCSTVHVIEHLGARPVLVDVEPDTLCIDPSAVEAAVTPRTVGILPVHVYGHPCEMDALLDIARARGLFVLEDAAHAFPARYKGRMVGTIGTATVLSFYATKNITTAEGGMVLGGEGLVADARLWSLHGMSRDAYKRYSAEGSWFYEVVLPGFKCNMTDLQASLGLRQLEKLAGFQRRRREVVDAYNRAFGALDELQTPAERAAVEPALHIYPLRLNLERLAIDRRRFIEELKARNIGASVHFIPNHLHPYYRDRYGFRPGDFPVAYEQYQRLVSLPLHPRLSDEDVHDVIEAVTGVVKRFACVTAGRGIP
ncbi:MAG: UDP-4-amino-4-deoxy-L-arabinose--oxoglutarate aminotransferase, partial [Acidobacteria bacterium]|nr:UDP-4-amino-4-deoxy-L-arabinose--oxoglutarate aminotransferase [Acidobacteriota bacterium]